MMNRTIEEQAIAYVDGALAPEEQDRFRELLAQRADLRLLVEEHEELRAAIVQAFGPPPGEAVPDGLEAMILDDGAGVVTAIDKARAEKKRRVHLPGWQQWASMAAALAIGFVGAQLLDGMPGSSLVAESDGGLAARGALAQRLDRQLSGEEGLGPVRVALSFRSAEGICRVFSLETGMAGLACRQGEEWKIRSIMTTGKDGAPSPYRLASSDLPASLMAEVDQLIEGPVLDRQMETAARENHWE
jgi:hypothetical protein